MNTTPFNIHYEYNDALHHAQIRPCCREDNVVDYAVWEDNELAFTITRHTDTGKWVVALKNADDYIDNEKVQAMGTMIEQKIREQTN